MVYTVYTCIPPMRMVSDWGILGMDPIALALDIYLLTL